MIGRILGPYRIIEKIGAGGMGEVYRARDDRLERDVALKVLPVGTLADEAARQRFRKEALALARLNHPNIATVFDFGTQDGVDFLVMELVAGASLSDKAAAGPLPEKEVLRIGAQLAEGLAAAHEQHVVHRDLKPSNLRLTPDGRLKILDFGLAKLLRPVSEMAATASLSETHAVVGTLPYMAPEQLRAEAVDARTDIYAAGCVLYEMATGRRPFQETLSTALTDAILHTPAPPPGRLQPDLTPDLERIIVKCLEKDPESRYQSAKELLVDLRRLAAPSAIPSTPSPRAPARGRIAALLRPLPLGIGAALVAVVLLLGFNLGRLRDRLSGRPAAPEINSLAVLPLENLSRDPEQEYFADGMTEALIAELSKISALQVISRTSAMQYKGVKKPMPQIARELGVDALIEGSVVREGDQVRITVQLIHGPTDKHLWAESYQREMRGILALQGEVARAIANEVRVKLTPQEEVRLASARPVDPAAYEAYLKGRYHWNRRTGQDLRKATEYFLSATELDPTYSLAYAGLADSYALYNFYDVLPARESFPEARAAAERALQLDPTLVEAQTTIAFVTFYYDWDWTAADSQLERILQRRPDYANARQWYAEYLSLMGRHEEAIREIKQAQAHDPLSSIMRSQEAGFYYYARHYDEAIETCRRTLSLDPRWSQAYTILGHTYEAQGLFNESLDAYRRARELSGDTLRYDLEIARVEARSGRRREARETLNRVLGMPPQTQQMLGPHLAFVFAALGERDRAMLLLEKAYQDRHVRLCMLKVDSRFDLLRDDPRFQDLLRRMNFPQ